MQEFTSVIASSYDAESLAPMLTEKASEGWSVVSIVSAGTNVVAYLTRGGDAAAAAPAAVAPAATEPVAEPEPEVAAPEPEPEVAAEPEPEPEPEIEESAAVAAAATAIAPSLPGESMAEPEPEPEPTVDPAVAGAAAAAVAAADEPAGWGAAPEGDSGDADTSVADLAAQIGDGEATSETTQMDPVVAAEPEPEPAAEPAAEEQAAAGESGVPAGWYADPSGRFELRYWDGAAWTEHVSRAGQQYTDPPVA